jgi:hypothetical protein
MFSSALSSGAYMVVDKINHRIYTIDTVYPKFAVGYTPSVGDVTINLSKLEKGMAEGRYRLKYLGL